MAFFFAFVVFVLSLFEGLPQLLKQLLWLVPIVMAALATLRTIRVLSVDRRGVPATATVIEIEARSNMVVRDGMRSRRARYVFSYDMDGQNHVAKSTWGLRPEGVPPSVGNQIEILVDPENPSRAIMVDEQPVRPAPLA